MDIVAKLKSGQIGVIPTDTIYGVVGSAMKQDVVARIYKLRRRTPSKPMIILIGSIEDLKRFSCQPRRLQAKLLKRIWPNSVSVILDCDDPSFEYLHRRTKTLAFRMPNNPKLLELLTQTGPLVAPSANLEGEKPAETIEEAKNYFRDDVDFYVDAGRLQSEPSTIIELKDNKFTIIRQGAFKIDQNFVK